MQYPSLGGGGVCLPGGVCPRGVYIPLWTDRHLWIHNLSATTVAVGNNPMWLYVGVCLLSSMNTSTQSVKPIFLRVLYRFRCRAVWTHYNHVIQKIFHDLRLSFAMVAKRSLFIVAKNVAVKIRCPCKKKGSSGTCDPIFGHISEVAA